MVAFTCLPQWPFSIHHFFIASRSWAPVLPFWHAGKTMSQVKYGIPRKRVKGKNCSACRGL
jgi:hypothetical protein